MHSRRMHTLLSRLLLSSFSLSILALNGCTPTLLFIHLMPIRSCWMPSSLGTVSLTIKTCFFVGDHRMMTGLSEVVIMSVGNLDLHSLTSHFLPGLMFYPAWARSALIVLLVQTRQAASGDTEASFWSTLSCSLSLLPASLAPGRACNNPVP